MLLLHLCICFDAVVAFTFLTKRYLHCQTKFRQIFQQVAVKNEIKIGNDGEK